MSMFTTIVSPAADDLPRATCRSLPHCLRHSLPEEALDDARGLVAFLRGMAFLQTVAVHHDAEMEMSAAACRGLTLVVDLLTDKLDIAAGVYRFPSIGGSDDPQLARREVE